jgi:hypothetical protein
MFPGPVDMDHPDQGQYAVPNSGGETHIRGETLEPVYELQHASVVAQIAGTGHGQVVQETAGWYLTQLPRTQISSWLQTLPQGLPIRPPPQLSGSVWGLTQAYALLPPPMLTWQLADPRGHEP